MHYLASSRLSGFSHRDWEPPGFRLFWPVLSRRSGQRLSKVSRCLHLPGKGALQLGAGAALCIAFPSWLRGGLPTWKNRSQVFRKFFLERENCKKTSPMHPGLHSPPHQGLSEAEAGACWDWRIWTRDRVRSELGAGGYKGHAGGHGHKLWAAGRRGQASSGPRTAGSFWETPKPGRPLVPSPTQLLAVLSLGEKLQGPPWAGMTCLRLRVPNLTVHLPVHSQPRCQLHCARPSCSLHRRLVHLALVHAWPLLSWVRPQRA